MSRPDLSCAARVPTSRRSLDRTALFLGLGLCAFLGCSRATGMTGEEDVDSVAFISGSDASVFPVDLSWNSTFLEAELTNHLGMRLVVIPQGEFLMGSIDSEDDWNADETPHRVRISRPFYLAAHEVTVAQFRRFVDATGYKTDAEKSDSVSVGFNVSAGRLEDLHQLNWRHPIIPQGDDHPVVHVSWNDAVAFCRWLSGMEGKPYRLPTEAEWEYACRAGSRTRYWSGDDEESVRRVANFNGPRSGQTGAAGSSGTRLLFTLPVGSLPKNDFGLCDMHGNVMEWCSDWYDREYYHHSSASDPQGPPSGSHRVTRGGSFVLRPWSGRSANRCARAPSNYGPDLGFRVAMACR
jgi:formylglycine-generating enzyme